MTPDPIRHFHPDYASARRAFQQAAAARGAALRSDPIDARGPHDEELALDTAYLGPSSPRQLLVVSSGIHGVEGFAGSAVQHRLLAEQLDGLDLPRDTGLLLVHAVNPFGFAHLRRVNEGNVDLNRNFVRHPEGHVSNPDYDTLYDAINPDTLDPEVDTRHRGRLLAFAQEHGFRRLQEVLSRGQYVHPEGLQFGGLREEASNRLLRGLVREELRGATRVCWVDLHTGLGPWGEYEIIMELPKGDPEFVRARRWFGEPTRSTVSGESVSAPLVGTIESGMHEVVPAEVELTIGAAEFGTYDPTRVLAAMRADNWLHRHGDLDSEQGRAIKQELVEMFRPVDPAWGAKVLGGAARVIAQARDGLASAPDHTGT